MAFSKARRLSDFIAADGSIPTGKFASSTITSDHIVDASIVPSDLHATLNLTGKALTVATASSTTNTTAVASTAFVQQELTSGLAPKSTIASPTFTGTPAAPTASGSTSTTQLATTAFVQQELTTLIGGAPSTLNDLNELAAAINDDANYNSTLTTALATKLPLAGGTLTGALSGTTAAFNAGATNVVATFTSTDGYAAIKLADNGGNVELTAVGNDFHIQNAGAAAKMVIKNDGKVGIGTASIDNNAKLHIEDSAYPIINLDRSSSLTTGNHLGYINFQNNGDIYGYMGAWVESASGTDGKLAFATQNGTSLVEKMTINSTGHLTLIAASGFSGLNNSLLGSTNGYLYAMGGSAGLYLADNSDLSNAIGIRNANYIDFTTGGVSTHKFDTAGIHFQRADGQSITAKESLAITIDSDNNNASRVFQVKDGSGNVLLNLHDDFRTEVGTLQFNSLRSAGFGTVSSFSAAANDWVDVAAVPYGRNIATLKFFWDGLSAPSSAHHGNMEFDIGSHYGTSYYYGWDTYINLKASSAHNSFFIKEARIITPNGSGATGYFQVKFGVAVSTGTFRSYVTHRDESCSIDPVTPAVNNSRSGTTLATIKLDNRPALATSRDFTTSGKMRASAQPAFFATLTSGVTAVSNLNSDIVFNNEQLDQGGCYNGSNGRFTAPCDGVYSFGINILVYPHTTGVLTPWFYKNGSGYGTTTQQGHEGSSHTAVVRQTVIKLEAGDYVTVRMALGGGNSGANIYGGQTSFHGHMIG